MIRSEIKQLNKKIYLEPAWKPHSLYDSIIENPPDGYEFITSRTIDSKIFRAASKISPSYRVLELLDNIVPSTLIKSRWERFKKIPRGTALTYSCGHLVFRDEPWVVDFEYLSALAGLNPRHFKKYKKLIEATFSLANCKKIICWCEAGKRTALLNLDCSDFESKLEVVPFAGQKRHFEKILVSDKIKLLFVNSGNIPRQFHYKGGKEVLEAFRILRGRYDNLELVVRSDIPRELKKRYGGIGNLRIIDSVIPWEELEEEFKTAAIFLYPTHSSQDMVVLDAMSYELPVVITDVFANPEVVENGRTGFVIRKSETASYYYLEDIIPARDTSRLRKIDMTPDARVVHDLVEKTSILIENEDLRRQMGKAARWEVEHGRFSIEWRNEKLKRIFDEATS